MNKIMISVLLGVGLFASGCVVSSNNAEAELTNTTAVADNYLNPENYTWKNSTQQEKRTYILGLLLGKKSGCATSANWASTIYKVDPLPLIEKCLEPYVGMNSLEQINRSVSLVDEAVGAGWVDDGYPVEKVARLAMLVSAKNFSDAAFWDDLSKRKQRIFEDIAKQQVKEATTPKPKPKLDNSSMLEIFDQNARDLMGI